MKTLSIMAILSVMGITIASASRLPATTPNTSWENLAVQAQPAGTSLGSFNGVIAYSNGSNTGNDFGSNYINGVYIGMKWQCVEYVRRYYYLVYGLDLARLHKGDAKTWYDNAAKMGLSSFPNGSSTSPQVGDILASNGGSYGHVAIIRSVSNSQVCTIQQNFTSTSQDVDKCLSLTFLNGSYTVGGFTSSLPIRGWIRRQGTVAPPPCSPGSSESFLVNGQPPVHPNGTLIKLRNDATYYVIVNRQKRGIPSLDILHKLYGGEDSEFEFHDVVTVSAAEFNSYSTGPVVNAPLPGNGRSQPNGRLIKRVGGAEISIVSDGLRRPFPNASIFQNLGYVFCNVTEIPDYDSYPAGTPVDGTAGVVNCSSTAISSGSSISGNLTDSDCNAPNRSGMKADLYTFNGTTGQRVTITMSSSAFDTYLILTRTGGGMLPVTDDDGGGGTNSRINEFTLPATGSYTIEATAYSSNGRGAYSIVLALNGGTCSSIAIAFNSSTVGTLTDTDCEAPHRSGKKADLYTFNGTAGQRVTITMSSSAFDTYLILSITGGVSLIVDDDGGGNLNSRISNFTLPATGSYTIEATAYSSSGRGGYSLGLGLGQLQTIFLVHGLSQGSADMQGLRTSLLDPVHGIDRSRFQVDAGFDWSQCANNRNCSSDCTIPNGAHALADYINSRNPSGDIILIGYSMGGLLSRDMMLNNYSGVFNNRRVAALITLGTPNVGYPYCEIDATTPLVGKCPTLVQQMASHFRLRQNENLIVVSNYLHDLTTRWGASSFLGMPRQWMAAAGTFCSDATRTCEWNEVSRSVNNGCPDSNNSSDGVVCEQSARFSVNVGNTPNIRWSDANYAHVESYRSFSVLCGNWGGNRHVLFNPPAGGDLVRRIKELINEL